MNLPHFIRRQHATTLVVVASLTLAACFPVRFDAGMSIPEPLISKMPASIALYIPPEFAQFTQKEKRWSMKWEIGLGKAHTQGFTRLLNSMFERVVMVESVDAGTRVPEKVGAILEPAIEEYAFVTPRDAGSSFFAVTIKYRMSVYTPEGRLADSWAFTGYGSAPSAGMSDKDSMQRATALALRDAGAKLAVEFRDQEIVRELLPSPDALAKPGASPTPATPAPGEPPANTPAAGSEQTPAEAGATAPGTNEQQPAAEEPEEPAEEAPGEPASAEPTAPTETAPPAPAENTAPAPTT